MSFDRPAAMKTGLAKFFAIPAITRETGLAKATAVVIVFALDNSTACAVVAEDELPERPHAAPGVAKSKGPPVIARGASIKEFISPTFARIDAKLETQKIMWLRCCTTTRG